MSILTSDSCQSTALPCPFGDVPTTGRGITPLNLKTQSQRSERDLSNASGLSVHVDYLRFIGTGISTESFLSLLAIAGNRQEFDHKQETWQSLGKGCRLYKDSARTCQGIKILYEQNEDETFDYCVDISGTVLSSLMTSDVWRLCLSMEYPSFNSHCSRFDVAIDDYSYKNLITDCMDAIKEGDFHGFRDAKPFYGNLCKGESVQGLYIGSRTTERFVRIYDTKEKHGFEAIRWEQENKGRYARELCREFCLKGTEGRGDSLSDDFRNDEELSMFLGQYLAMYAIGHVGFKDKSKQYDNGQVSNLENLPFWQNFIDRIGGTLKISVQQIKPTLDKKKAWIERSVAKTLATIRKGLGIDNYLVWYQELMFSGLEKMTNYDRLLVNEYQQLALS